MNEFTCKKCGEECFVDGEYPKFIIWCDTCNTYAKGSEDYASDWLINKIDAIYDYLKEK